MRSLGENELKRCIRIFLCLSLVQYGFTALAQDFSNVGVPLVFSAERDKVLTTACLSVNSRNYEPSSTALNGKPGSAEYSLGLVLRAMADGNEAELRALSDAWTGQPRQNVDNQIKAFLEQFKHIRALGADHAFIFDNLVVFFVKFETKSGRGGFVSPFVFLRQAGKEYKFLPDRPNVLPLVILREWYDSERGPRLAGQARYCDTSAMRLATYRMPLSSLPSDTTTALLFSGFTDTDQSGEGLLKTVKSYVGQLNSLAISGRVDALKPIISSTSWHRVSSIGGTKEETSYLQDLASRRLRFVVDLGSVAVVYTRAGSDGIRTVYLRREGGSWKWTNVGLINSSSRVFERKEMMVAAAADVPFATLRRSVADR